MSQSPDSAVANDPLRTDGPGPDEDRRSDRSAEHSASEPEGTEPPGSAEAEPGGSDPSPDDKPGRGLA